ncbi:sulfurtransferase TusA family protein [Vulcanisaeta thermophila]|uniref:sulfurtransferase TusA family protein n=1 Tax=Vulcanisaeta thermophila TaxID=867917 RepID=UPI00117DA3EC|nr:sulfurtransferase TusA family protein [Vulcanisaeta thermophila]
MRADRINDKYVVDARGYACPYPQVFALKALKEAQPGSVVEVLVDNPPSCENVPNAVRRAGHEVLGVVQENGYWRIIIRRR